MVRLARVRPIVHIHRPVWATHSAPGSQVARWCVLVCLPQDWGEDGQEIPGPHQRAYPAHLEEVARDIAAPSASLPEREPEQARQGARELIPPGNGVSRTDRVGQQLGNYRLLRLLGRGGNASVYLGEHVYLKSHAALKILHTYLSDQDAPQFLTEAQTLASLSHPQIVRVLDFAVQEGTPFLVMEYAPHGNLRQRHPPGTRLPLETIVAYVQQIAAALQYAHDQRLMHRDIKPENMLLGSQFEVLLSDFGLAMFTPHTLSMSTQAMD
jgi:tRNA A-37 threonylcarbamoyl transferase component Bud32